MRRARISLVLLSLASLCARAQIENTKHNLSTSGPGTIVAQSETEICKFCHTPHSAVVPTPLWGHTTSSGTVVPYQSSTLSSTVPSTVTGATRLCLSCHDGQVAVNSLATSTPTMRNNVTVLTGPSNLGTALVADHPVSFIPTVAGNFELRNPPSDPSLAGAVHLDNTGTLQCTACHDPHRDNRDATVKKFLNASNAYSAMCITCHVKQYWSDPANAHATSPVPFTAAQGSHAGYGTVAAEGCEACHKPHKSAHPQQILKANEEQVCAPCHQGTLAGGATRVNISSAAAGPFSKIYAHPTYAISGKHTPRPYIPRANSPTELTSDLSGPNRHAECQDCHNPHAAATRPGASGNHYGGGYPTRAASASLDLNGVWGVEPAPTMAWTIPVQSAFARVDPVTAEYQVCYKCHSSYAYNFTPPQAQAIGTNGVVTQTDQSLEFNPLNSAYHAVQGASKVTRAALLAPWTVASSMYCSDCHGEDDVASGWTVPARSGPHGSNQPFIMRAGWSPATGKNTPNDLCFRCHDFNAFRNGKSSATWFTSGGDDLHQKHVFDEGKPCMACHSAVPHGFNREAMIVYGAASATPDPAPYRVNGVSKIKSWRRRQGNYQKEDCSTDTGCH